MYLYPYEFFCNHILPYIWVLIGVACFLFIAYEFSWVDRDLKIKQLRKIIKQKNKEIKKLKSIGNFIYENYLEKNNKD